MLNQFISPDNRGFATQSEQDLLEDLIIESIQAWGQEFFYIPRTVVAKDEILGEDRLSEFKTVYGIEMYFENVDNYGGQGTFLQKFGLMNEQSATLSVSRRRWQELLRSDTNKVLPNRPAEGDLLYFPLSQGLFEIKFVQDKDPFYQLGKLYTWKLDVELFQYSSERINTGIEDIDIFEDLKSHDISIGNNVEEPQSYGDNIKMDDESQDFIVIKNNPIGNT